MQSSHKVALAAVALVLALGAAAVGCESRDVKKGPATGPSANEAGVPSSTPPMADLGQQEEQPEESGNEDPAVKAAPAGSTPRTNAPAIGLPSQALSPRPRTARDASMQAATSTRFTDPSVGDLPARKISTFGPFFQTRCKTATISKDDPIVFPGQRGAAHEHIFYGGLKADFDATETEMRAGGTTCSIVGDTASYWVPPLLSTERRCTRRRRGPTTTPTESRSVNARPSLPV